MGILGANQRFSLKIHQFARRRREKNENLETIFSNFVEFEKSQKHSQLSGKYENLKTIIF